MVPGLQKALSGAHELECGALKVELARRGWRYAELAKRTGLSVGTIRNIVSGGNRFFRARYRINCALGASVFDVPEEFLVMYERSNSKKKTHRAHTASRR